MPYVDLTTVQATDPGDPLTAAWCDTVHENFEFLDDQPSASVASSISQSVTTSTNTVLSATTENYDNDAMHSTVTNPSRITVQTPGRYTCFATVEYIAGAGRRLTDFLVDGATVLLGDSRIASQAAGSTGTADRISITRTRALVAGQYVEVRVNQNSGGNLNTQLIEFAVQRHTR